MDLADRLAMDALALSERAAEQNDAEWALHYAQAAEALTNAAVAAAGVSEGLPRDRGDIPTWDDVKAELVSRFFALADDPALRDRGGELRPATAARCVEGWMDELKPESLK